MDQTKQVLMLLPAMRMDEPFFLHKCPDPVARQTAPMLVLARQVDTARPLVQEMYQPHGPRQMHTHYRPTPKYKMSST